jgi:hypothetical protein
MPADTSNLLADHLQAQGLGTVEEFITSRDSDGTLDRIEIPAYPTAVIVRDGSAAHEALKSQGKFAIGYFAVSGRDYSLVMIA